MRYELKRWETDHICALADLRGKPKRATGVQDRRHKRTQPDPDRVGMTGEWAVTKSLGIDGVMMSTQLKGDNGYDFAPYLPPFRRPLRFDVKTTTHATGKLAIPEWQRDSGLTDVYVLCVAEGAGEGADWRPSAVTIVGFTTPGVWSQKAQERWLGRRPILTMLQKELVPWSLAAVFTSLVAQGLDSARLMRPQAPPTGR